MPGPFGLTQMRACPRCGETFDRQVAPEGIERRNRVAGMTRDDRAVENANRDGRDDIRVNAMRLQRADRPAFERAERAAALQDEHVLRRQCAKARARLRECCATAREIAPVSDHLFRGDGFVGRRAGREHRAQDVVPHE